MVDLFGMSKPATSGSGSTVNPLSMLENLKNVLRGAAPEKEDEVDIRYGMSGKHYSQYKDAKQLVNESNA